MIVSPGEDEIAVPTDSVEELISNGTISAIVSAVPSPSVVSAADGVIGDFC